MTRTWFAQDLETVATFWRILRRDGVTFGFTTHDRDLWFDGVLHGASPGMVPSSIRKRADLDPDSVEVQGMLSDDAITGADLASGRFDGSRVLIGLIDWETLERMTLYSGTLGEVTQEGEDFSASLASRKAELQRDPIPRTSPTCRAAFCGPGCNLNPQMFTREVKLLAIDAPANAATFETDVDAALYVGGELRWVDGPRAGIAMTIMSADPAGGLVLDAPLDEATPPGSAAVLREGCDRTLETCAARFGNAVNFRGEPFLPGNDMLTRYPSPIQ